jgi:signal transduction histidine kinase
MLNRSLFVRVVGPTVFVSLLLIVLCSVTALYLYRQQTDTANIVDENVGSRAAATELEIRLKDLLLVLRVAANNLAGASSQVEALQGQIQSALDEARSFADKDEEKRLVGQLETAFARHRQEWRKVMKHEADADATVPRKIVETELLPTCRKLHDFNSQQIEDSNAAHRQTMVWMAWGVAGIGLVGSLAGVLLGYGVARAIRRSIHKLSVRVRDAAGKLRRDVGTVVVTEDTDLHNLHEQMHGLVGEIEQVVEKLQQREREVLRAEQMAAVGQLAAGAAHELRNPLTSIKMLIQANREEAEANGVPAEDLHIIDEEIRRMERCLRTFLDFARPPQPQRRPLDLAGVVERTFALISGRARKQQVTLQFTPPDTPILVEADGEQLQQLLVNLALNALDAMPRGGTLEVRLETTSSDTVELSVRDSGPGITAPMLSRLFEPFVSSKETGLGLGLVVSRRIAESHGGKLTAVNLSGQGACFTLTLPAVAEPVSHT